MPSKLTRKTSRTPCRMSQAARINIVGLLVVFTCESFLRWSLVETVASLPARRYFPGSEKTDWLLKMA